MINHTTSLALLLALLTSGNAIAVDDLVLDKIIAIVNDGVVLASDLRAESSLLKQQAASNRQTLPPDSVLRERVLQRLIDQEIQRQHAKEIGIVVDANSVNRAIEQIARGNNMDTLQLRQTMQSQGFNYSHFRSTIEQELLLSRLIQRDVESRIRVSEQEIDDFVDTLNNNADDQQQYLIQHILIAVAPSATAEELSKAQTRASDVLDQLEAGDSFSQVAVAHSDGAQALKGGDLGWRTLQEVPDFLAEALRNLDVGSLSKPLRSQNGLHIVRLANKRSGSQTAVEQTLARHIFLAGDQAGKAESILATIRKRIAAGESFASMAAEFSEDPNSSANGGELPWFSTGQMPAEFGTNRCGGYDRQSQPAFSNPIRLAHNRSNRAQSGGTE